MADPEQAAGQVSSTARFPFEGTEPVTPVQYGALCWRRTDDGVQVLLVTSRETGRWVIPKGWPVTGLSPEATAAREAWEEAGVRGAVSGRALGAFDYDKVLDRSVEPPRAVICRVAVYPIEAVARARDFPESDERRHKWMSRKKAARKVAEPGLAAIIAAFDPDAAGP